jgi:hypothetical protein
LEANPSPGENNLIPDTERQEMRSYLLGTLDRDLKTQFEERILTEPSVYQELLIDEEDLIDQYVRGELSAFEQEQFESHFLITAERQKNLRFGKLLQEYVNFHIEESPVPVHSFSFLHKPVRRWASLGLVAAIFSAAGIIIVRGFVNRREAACVVQQTPSRVMTVTLAPGSAGTQGSTAQRVNLPPYGVDVTLELELRNSTFRNYKSELFRENKSLKISDALRIEAKGEQRVVPFTVTGEILSPGDYQVKLSGVLDSGADEFIDNYSFRVIE